MENLIERLKEWGRVHNFETQIRNDHFNDPVIYFFDRLLNRYFAFTLFNEMVGQEERLISEIEWYMMEVD